MSYDQYRQISSGDGSAGSSGEDALLVEEFEEFLRTYYHEAVGTLAQRFPGDQKSLDVSYRDLFQFSPELAADWRENPAEVREYAEEALRKHDLPADVSLANAHVRLGDLPDEHAHHPGGYSLDEDSGTYLGVQGEVVVCSDVYARITEAGFECTRCGTMSYIAQGGSGDGFQEPHECQGCERQGPFDINFDQSTFINAQKFRVSEPPEVAGGEGETIDVYVEDDLAERVETGDRVVVGGTLHLRQLSDGQEKTGKFEAYLTGESIDVSTTDHNKMNITPGEKDQIRAIANGERGDPLKLAAESLAPKVVGYDHIKRMAILSMVGGERVTYPDGSEDRGAINMLLLGDPGTTKSKIVDRVEHVSPRAVGVSGKGAREAGITASAVRDDFSDGEWTLKAGAFVKANGGMVCIDELDDMPSEVRSAMLEPMSKGTIHVSKAGINTRLNTRVGVIAAGNPKYGRWDEHEPVGQQFDFDSPLLSRFDVIYTLSDEPDREDDRKIANHISRHRELGKRYTRDPSSLTEEEREEVEPPISGNLLKKYIALAKRQPAPEFENETVRTDLDESFVDLRGANGYDQNSPVPTTFRKQEAILRIAEAAAKLEFSDTITTRHTSIAMEAVGRSMRDYGQDEDGVFDADIVETGASMSQKDREKLLEETLIDLEKDYDDGVPREELVAAVDGQIEEKMVHDTIDKWSNKRWVYEPKKNQTVRWMRGK